MNITSKKYDFLQNNKAGHILKGLLCQAGKKLDLVWRFETGDEITSLCIANYITSWEQKKQIIVGSKDRCVYSLSIDKKLLWKYCAQDEILCLYTSDLTCDESDEIVVGSKDQSIYVLDPMGRLMRKYLMEGPITSVTIARNPMQNFIIAGSSNGYIYLLDNQGGIQWKYYCGDNCGVNGLCAAFFEENGRNNIVAGTSQGEVIILDYEKRKLLRRFKKPGSIHAVMARDIDNDGDTEIMVCSDSCCLYILNSYGWEKWKFKTKDSVCSIHCGDIDIDKRLEIIIGTKDDYIYVLDAEGNFKWKYKTDHTVWSIYGASWSHPRSYDLLAGLSNRMVYYYRIYEWCYYSPEINRAYLSLLHNGKTEWEILEGLSRDKNEYLRQFSIRKLLELACYRALRQNIVHCFENMLDDPEPIIRKTVIKSLANLSEYNPDLAIKAFSTEKFEQDGAVRNTIVRESANLALRFPNKRGDIFSRLLALNQEWGQIDRKAIINLFDIAHDELITGNINKAFIDFKLLADRGIDLISKYKTDGYVCSLACGNMGRNNVPVIALASRNNHLYVFDQRGKLKWDKLTETYSQRIFIEDLNNDGLAEIIVGGVNGIFQFFSKDGEEKGRIQFYTQVNDFYLVKQGNGQGDGLVIGSQDGKVYYLDQFGREKWCFQTKGCVLSVYVEDINDDGYPEIAVGTLHGDLFLLNLKGDLLWKRDFESDIRTISALWEDAIDLIIGTRAGRIYALNAQGEIKWQQSCDSVINNIWISQINDIKRIVVATQDALLIILDAEGIKTGEIETFGSVTALSCIDINQDGQKEIILGAKDDYVYIYQFVDNQKIKAYMEKCKELSKISKKKLCFPRTDIIKLIKSNFENGEGKEKVVLVGYLGTGKTNLLWQLSSGALGEMYLPVYINLGYIKLSGLGHFLWSLSEKITKELYRKEINPLCPVKSEFIENPQETFTGFLEDLSGQLDAKKLLILFDDFDRLQTEVRRGNMSHEVFPIFEDMIKTKKCYFILTLSSYDFDLERKSGYLFLNDALIIDVNFVDRFNAQKELLYQLGDNLENKQEIVNKILKITGGHAHYLQISFNLLITYLHKNQKDQLTQKDWSILYAKIKENTEVELHNPWETFLPHEKVVLSSLARLSPQGAAKADIRNDLGIFSSLICSFHLAAILKNLAKKSILYETFTDNTIQYTFTISLFRDWVKNNTNPFQVISENDEAILQGIPLRLFSRQQKSIQDREQMDLFLNTIGLEFKQWQVLAMLSEKWSKLVDRKSEINKIAVNDFVQCFAKLLGFSVKEVLEYPKITCFRFETPTIRLKKLANMILAVPITQQPDEVDFQLLVGLIANLNAAPNTFMILQLEESYVFEKLVSHSKLDLVVLNQERLKNIFLSPNYLHALIDDVILKYIDLIDLSPYETMGPVDSMFFGRLEEVKTMRQMSHKSFAIVGARQLGKTSLMFKVRDLILPDNKIKTLYLDCSTYYESLQLCQAIIDGLDVFEKVTITNLNQFKKVIREWCMQEKIMVNLFLDEIDPLLSLDKEQNEFLFKTFRSLSQEKKINLIVAGYEELFIRTKDIKSPLFNYLELIRLSSLDKRAAAQLITEPMKELGIRMEDEDAVIKEIFAITSCFPNLIQYLCKKLIQLIACQRRRVIYLTDLTQVKKDPDFQDYIISRFFSHLTSLDKVIVLLLLGEPEISVSLIDSKLRENSIHLSQQALSEEIDKFIIAAIFSRTKKGLKFVLPYFSYILSENMEKELLLKQLLREVYHEKSKSL